MSVVKIFACLGLEQKGVFFKGFKKNLGTNKFPMQKLAIFRKELRGGVQGVRRTSDSAD
jgi:hypothetical protein